MRSVRAFWLLAVAMLVTLSFTAEGSAQQQAARKLVPGVFKTIKPEISEGDTFTREEMLGFNVDTTYQPFLTPATALLREEIKSVEFRRNVWGLEFSFKAPRFIEALVPTASGTVEPRLVWYMIYKVKNPGETIYTELSPQGLPQIQSRSEPVTFIPKFWLYAEDSQEQYPDRLLPVVIPQIEAREQPPMPLLDSISISKTPIPPSTADVDNSVWGVVTWSDVNPDTDRFSIFAQGLTNAYYWRNVEAGGKKFPRFAVRTLQVNFWRPGDSESTDESEIRYGIPDRPNYRWFWKPLD